MRLTLTIIVLSCLAVMIWAASPSAAQVVGTVGTVNTTAGTEVHATGVGLISKVAPGEFLPVAVKLLNFGNSNRADVTVSYEIVAIKGNRIYFSRETVAVETTASFVKTIQIPFNVPPGRYIVKSSIAYKDQVVPATTEFHFIVERKIAGFFASEFYFYTGATLLISVITGLIGHLWVRHRRITRIMPIDYAYIPKSERIFYELLSDTVLEMRERIGDIALDIAAHIEGLKIDEKTGRILQLTADPAKVMALLVSGYEQVLGKKTNYTF